MTTKEERTARYEAHKDKRRKNLDRKTNLPEYRVMFGREIRTDDKRWMVTDGNYEVINESPIQAFRDLATILGYKHV